MDRKFTFRIIFLLAFLFTGIFAFGQASTDEFQDALKKADEYFQNGDYMNAKAAYQLASRLNPEDQHTKDRLKESLQLLRVQVEQRGKYKSQLKLADELFGQKSYEKAIIAYQQAKQILSKDTYPDEKVAECNNLIAAEKANREQYNKMISEADALLKTEKYEDAKLKYKQALEYIDYEQYPKDQIASIDKTLNSIIQQQSVYENAIADAENFIKRKDYQNAVLSYEKAAELNPDATEPAMKLSELNSFLKVYERYTALVIQADELYIGKMYSEAKIKYEAALKVLPDEPYPKDIINNINAILDEKAISDWEKYDELISEADKLFDQEDYEKAMDTYQNALRFKPDGDYASNKINSINDILDLRKSKEEAYVNAIARADEFYNSNDYNGAKAEYEKAHDIKPMEQYPKVKIDEIDVIMANLKNKLDIYNSNIDGADKLFDIGDYEEALGQYKKALEVLPDKQYPKDKISVINDILNKADQARQAYEKAIANADHHFENKEYEDAKIDYITAMEIIPEEQYPKEQLGVINGLLAEIKAKEESFGIAVKIADQLLHDQKYEAALIEYRTALDIKNDEYATQKIDEINRILKNIANEQAKENAYQDAISEADKLFGEEKYTEAKTYYLQALSSKPDEELPKSRISEIDLIMKGIAALDDQYTDRLTVAQQYLDSDNLEGALTEYRKALELKPEESLPAQKINEIESILENIRMQNENYNIAITLADRLFEEKKYDEALLKYKEAESVLPDVDYPKYKITETASIIEEIQRQKELDSQYELEISNGDKLFNEKEYNQALLSYRNASLLKPDEQYPIERITEIEGILNDIATEKQIQESYESAIALADQLFSSQSWSDAKTKYLEALTFKPKEEHPESRIQDIDMKLAEVARVKDIDDRYNASIIQADDLFSKALYEEARTKYNEALLIKPEETYPKQKIEEIRRLLDEISRQKAVDAEYNQLITKADEYFNTNLLEDAKTKYEEASIVKPEDQYPKDKIAEIIIMHEKIVAQEKDRAYNVSITRADNFLNEGKYKSAMEAYTAAMQIKPAESYPKRKHSEAESLYLAEREAKEVDYRKAVGEADAYFNDNIYDKAIENYEEAMRILPEEDYPAKQIALMKKIINDNAIVDVNQNSLLIKANNEKRFGFNPMPVNVRKENYILIKAKNPVDHNFKIYMNFGQDNTKNGGIAIRIPEATDEKEFLVRIGALYKWFTEDNNWLSIYPEGGDIEVSLIRISKSN